MSLLVPQLDRIADLATKESMRTLVAYIKNFVDKSKIDGNPPPTGFAFGPPAPPLALTVTANKGVFQSIITANPGNVASSIQYYLEASPRSDFAAVTVYPLGNALSASVNLGAARLYWRVRAKYPDSDFSGYVQYGAPTLVTGGESDTGGGNNLLVDPSFESNRVGTPLNVDLAAGVPFGDGWYVQLGKSIYHDARLEEGGQARTGARNLVIRSPKPGVTVPSDNVNYECRLISANRIPIAVGLAIRMAAYAAWGFNATPPANVFLTQRVGLVFYSATDAVLGELFVDVVNGGSAPYIVQQTSIVIPATIGGGTPQYVRAQLAGFVRNNSGSPWVVGGGSIYADLRFDDIKCVIQNTPFELTPISTSYTIIGTAPLTAATGGSPNQATITVGARTLQFGDGPVPYNGGSISGLLDNTDYYVYAEDAGYSGVVTWLATTTPQTANASPGRIVLGKVKTPAFGGGGTTGVGGGNGPAEISRHATQF